MLIKAISLLKKYLQIDFIRLLVLLALLYFILLSPKNHLNQWQIIQEKGYISWVTRFSPLTYYDAPDGVIGLEYDILQSFCKKYKLGLRVISASSNTELFRLFNKQHYDIAGANLSYTKQRAQNYLITSAYDTTYVELFSSYRKPKIKALSFLNHYQGLVLKSSSYELIAENLEKQYQAKIAKTDRYSLYEILLKVTQGEVDYTLADHNIVEIYSAYVPTLRQGFKLSENSEVVFLLQNLVDNSFKIQLDNFINDYSTSGKVQEYKKFIIASLPHIKPADTVNFLKNYNLRWQKIKSTIYQIANQYNISPTLLGAIAYQESHWNPKAVSPTLVKGIMMLTKTTAKEQNISNRLDVQQSLAGGVRHFLKMKAKIPARITEPDRTDFALAAYNLGYGNLEKARILTQKGGDNPDLWSDVRQYLPELNKISNNKINGKTAVTYVDNIHIYHNLLQWKEQQ